MINKISEAELKGYYKSIENSLVGNKKEKAKFIADIKESVDSFLKENDEATIDGIYAAIGTPGEIAESFVSDISPECIKKKLGVKRAVVIVLTIIVAIIFFYFGSNWIKDMQETPYYIVDDISETILWSEELR